MDCGLLVNSIFHPIPIEKLLLVYDSGIFWLLALNSPHDFSWLFPVNSQS